MEREPYPELEDMELPDGTPIRAHKRVDCHPPCALHAPSDHHMKDWPLIMRRDGRLERLCSHGIGHPDPDSLAHTKANYPDFLELLAVHGCDDCCIPPKVDLECRLGHSIAELRFTMPITGIVEAEYDRREIERKSDLLAEALLKTATPEQLRKAGAAGADFIWNEIEKRRFFDALARMQPEVLIDEGGYAELVDEANPQGPVQLCKRDGTVEVILPRADYDALRKAP